MNLTMPVNVFVRDLSPSLTPGFNRPDILEIISSDWDDYTGTVPGSKGLNVIAKIGEHYLEHRVD